MLAWCLSRISFIAYATGLSVCDSPNLYLEILSPSVMILRGDKARKVRPSQMELVPFYEIPKN
jgi:hypothetical protein